MKGVATRPGRAVATALVVTCAGLAGTQVFASEGGPPIPANDASRACPDRPLAQTTATSPDPGAPRPFAIAGRRIAPGTAERVVLPASQSFVGARVDTPVVVIRGETAGPTLCLIAGIHGDELDGTETVRRVLARIRPQDLHGTLIGLPIANVHGFRRRSRDLPDRRDLNRAFPGRPFGSSAARIAYAIFDGVIRHCDAAVDFHSASFHRRSLPQVRGDFTSPEILTLARGLGIAVAVHHPGIAGTLRREASARGIPTVLYEGGESSRLQDREISRAEDGVLRLLRSIGMLRIAVDPADPPQEIFFDARWVRVDHGGILVPSVELGDRVETGARLGTVFDPLGGERAVVRSPVTGRVIGMALPQVVLPGFAAFHIGDARPRRPPPGPAKIQARELADLEHAE